MRSLACLFMGLWASGGLLAQTVGDLNALALLADRYTAQVMTSQGDQREINLFKINGRSLAQPGALMRRGVDVQNWTFIYRILDPAGPDSSRTELPQRSVYVHCDRGEFTALDWSPVPVMDCRSLESRWIGISLDEAIRRLNDSGFSGGFSGVTLMRPMHPSYPDLCTYVFNCPTEHANVGISALTGEVLWSEVWNTGKPKAQSTP